MEAQVVPHVGRRMIFAVLLLVLGLARESWGQQAPRSEPFGAALGPQPSAPAPAAPAASLPSVAADTAPASREAQLEERVRQLEAMVNKLSTQMQQVGAAGGAPAPDVPARGIVGAPSVSGGVAPGQSLPANPPASARFDSPPVYENKKANVRFGPGFEIRSDDDEFIFQFHNLTQFEYRGYQQYGQGAVKDSFLMPRQWFMFSGRITKPIGYFVSLANGFDTVSMLDVFLDFDFDPRLRLRAGRFKTPFTYEFLAEPVQGLIQPERSIFFNNFGQNRDMGVMAFGRLFNSTLDYATGIFNGNRNGYVAPSDSKYISSFVNWKPFNNDKESVFENFNVGGSVWGGNATQNPVPAVLRTIVPIAGNAVAGVPFLAFNNNVRQSGMLTFWDLHLAWFYQQLAVLAEWGSGFQDYAQTSNLAARTHLPVESFYVQAGYFLTGETRSSLNVVRPHHPFSLSKNKFGLGAWELTARYSQLDLGSQVFTNGLADPNLWANRVNMTDLGFNWYVNQYVKFAFDWEHSMFNEPVLYSPGKRQLTSDLFLARIQLYF